jgi:hypothetical protein
MAGTLLLLCSLGLPQGGQAPAVRVDANGWPNLPPAVSTSRPARTDFDHPPAVAAGAAAPSGETAPVSALAATFRQVGHPSALADLGGVIARIRLTIFDAQGVEIGGHELFHEADLGTAARDRLVFTQARRVYGRDGAIVWAKQHNLLWPAAEQDARDELEVHGLLLRAPWAFADQERFVVLGQDVVQRAGAAVQRIRIQRRSPEAGAVGPQPQTAVDRFELYCHQDSHEPFELVYTLAATGSTRRVQLLDWRPHGSARLPTRRVFVDGDGKPQLQLEVVRLDVRQPLPQTQFRPVTPP